jgi:hypothetical protein
MSLAHLPVDEIDVRPHLSLKEAVVLARVSEKLVRKDIENRVLSVRHRADRLSFKWSDVFSFAAAYHRSIQITPDVRKPA